MPVLKETIACVSGASEPPGNREVLAKFKWRAGPDEKLLATGLYPSGQAKESSARETFGVYTPTGNGLVWDSALSATPENRPCSRDIKPVYQ